MFAYENGGWSPLEIPIGGGIASTIKQEQEGKNWE